MRVLFEQLPPRLLYAATALAAAHDVDSWSTERIQALKHEVVAKFQFESRISANVDDGTNDEYEFEAIPLVPTQVVRVRFRDIGQLPPMDLEDEVGRD